MLYKNGTFSYLRQSRTFVYAGNQNLVFEHAQSSYDILVAKYIFNVQFVNLYLPINSKSLVQFRIILMLKTIYDDIGQVNTMHITSQIITYYLSRFLKGVSIVRLGITIQSIAIKISKNTNINPSLATAISSLQQSSLEMS